MRRRFRISFLRDDEVSPRRRAVALLLAAVVALGSSVPDFVDSGSWPGLVALVIISLGAALIGTVAFSRLGVESEWEKAIRSNLGLIERSARTIAQSRQAPLHSDFRGRSDELRRWRREHARLRRLREDGGSAQRQGPIVLAMHGPPGSGKSALAHALARDISKEYAGGIVVANFGTSGTTRGPADISRDILLQLDWPDDEMPHETADRVATLRSLTRGKRILFLLDAVRDHDQVAQIMPGEAGCTVIITSRREIGTSLGLPPREPVAPMSLLDALEMLTAIAGVDWVADPETAVDLVELCDRLPLAVRSAAERIRDGQDPRYVVGILRPPRARLAALTYGGRSIQARIASEFERLSAPQQRALTLLASLDGESFVPWVLRPLMPLERGVSKSVVADLSAAQFLETDGQDPTGQARYRIPPLMRLYAIAHQNPDEVAAATARLVDAYVELIDEVLDAADPTYTLVRTGPRRWRSPGSAIANPLARHLDKIVHREYLNLVRVILAADMATHAAMIWRIAALLDGRTPVFPPGLRTAEEQAVQINRAFERGIAAARQCHSVVGEVHVHTAHAQFLIAEELYGQALSILDKAQRLIDEIATPQPGETAALKLRVARVRAWLFLEVGSYGHVRRELTDADAVIDQLTPVIQTPAVQTDIAIVSQFNADVDRVAESERWKRLLRPGVHGIAEFHASLAQAERLRRTGYWDDAVTLLRRLLSYDSAARSHTSVHYRLALYRIEHALHQQRDRSKDDAAAELRQRTVTEAIRHAAACVVSFGAIGDPVGQIRSRALLIRALVLSGRLMAATQLDIEVEADLQLSVGRPGAGAYLESLTARRRVAHAEVEIAHGRYESGWRSLTLAVQAFRRLEDWAAHGDAWRLLHQVYPEINAQSAPSAKSADKPPNQ